MRKSLLSFALLLTAAAPGRAAEDGEGPPATACGAKPPAGAVVLLGQGKPEGWVGSDGRAPIDWPFADGILTVGHGDIKTEKTFGDFELHLEFNVPYMPQARGQARGNSGVYLAGNHELQVLDSYGLPTESHECGAIYSQVAPSVNACKPPLQWQAYSVIFRKARVEGGKVAKKARVTVFQNGTKIIDDAEVVPTPGGLGNPEGSDGPLLLQDHGNKVQYRNIWIRPLG
ncbi:hypothetical protein OJF2_63380 [Aquisphaera giovannonii]|uniref:3-keto-alpha-glucoside-1,2-lyase/3-keto-2-hydroxy-glucal hydratase domain-containing protein n=1 Tax=Aquisphaera giovannonii TaxID=406548 RepID=A0A5B9WB79_9BACT|nr:DUF1080 domain-containing protein [Aquisphaera giovannonii]QEH37747.1 hypothetical protein OJF2_63380 [Aquisphaera giovannonii]